MLLERPKHTNLYSSNPMIKFGLSLFYRSNHFRSGVQSRQRTAAADGGQQRNILGAHLLAVLRQFPQVWIPPSATSASNRSKEFIAPMGLLLKSSTCAMACEPMNDRMLAARCRARYCFVALARLAAQVRSSRTAGRPPGSTRRSCTCCIDTPSAAFPATAAGPRPMSK